MSYACFGMVYGVPKAVLLSFVSPMSNFKGQISVGRMQEGRLSSLLLRGFGETFALEEFGAFQLTDSFVTKIILIIQCCYF